MAHILEIATRGAGLYEFTEALKPLARRDGVMTLLVRHTSCSLLIQENADPDVRHDLQAFFRRLVPPSDSPSMDWITHTSEGPDDMPAHIKAAMLGSSVTVPIRDGKLALGTWQGIYLCEHRNHGGARRVVVTLQGQIAG